MTFDESLQGIAGWYRDKCTYRHYYLSTCGKLISINKSNGSIRLYTIRVVHDPIQCKTPTHDTSSIALYDRIHAHPGRFVILVASYESKVWGGLYDMKHMNLTWDNGSNWDRVGSPRLVSDPSYTIRHNEYDFFEYRRVRTHTSRKDDSNASVNTLVSFE